MMNVSDYENVCEPLGPTSYDVSQDIQLVLSDVLGIIRTDNPVSYCPFCIGSFAGDAHLEGHLKSDHLTFLNELLTRSISLDQCPFCPAKFFTQHLVAKHSLIFHCYMLFETFFVKVRSRLKCMFCRVNIDKTSMSQHVSNFHALDFNDWFIGKFCVKTSGIAGIVELAHGPQQNSSPSMEIETLNEQFGGMKVVSSENRKISIIKKELPRKKIDSNQSSSKLSVCRKLRFEEGKENLLTPRNLRPRKSPLDSSKKINRNGSVSSWTSAIKKCSFQCGKCSVCFASHTQLVIHVKKEHKKLSLNLLQPFYHCALCGASFYNSSYLKKHSTVHSLSKFR